MTVEAKALFQSLESNPTDIGQCTFEREWDSRPVTSETAQHYLKIVARADLVVSDPPSSIMQMVDPQGTRPEAFCRTDERQSVQREALKAFRAKGGNVIRFVTINYGFPVFNLDFTRAALVVQRSVDSHFLAPDGTLKMSMEMAGGAEIYEKRGGSWQRIAYDMYYTAH